MPVKTKPKISPKASPDTRSSSFPPGKIGPGQAKRVAKYISVSLRPKRQLTLPREICEQLGIEPGDMLELALEGTTLVAKPKKAIALEALREIQDAFKRSGITEEELLEEAYKIRHGDTREK